MLLRKGIYPYEFMDYWEKFNEKSLPEKEELYSNLNLEDLQIRITIMQKEFVKILKWKIGDNIVISILKVTHYY